MNFHVSLQALDNITGFKVGQHASADPNIFL